MADAQSPEPMAGGATSGAAFSPVLIIFTAGVLAVFISLSCYAIITRYLSTDGDDGVGGGGDGGAVGFSRHDVDDDDDSQRPSPSEGLDQSLVEKITSCRYEAGLVVGAAECAVCLAEFRDGDGLRRLPGCGHGFHIACIDAWLKCHTNCPICRIDLHVLNNKRLDLEQGRG